MRRPLVFVPLTSELIPLFDIVKAGQASLVLEPAYQPTLMFSVSLGPTIVFPRIENGHS